MSFIRKPVSEIVVNSSMPWCVPTTSIFFSSQEGNWNNQGYGNLDANENMKSIVVNGAAHFLRWNGNYGLIPLCKIGSYTRCKILHRTAISISAVGFVACQRNSPFDEVFGKVVAQPCCITWCAGTVSVHLISRWSFQEDHWTRNTLKLAATHSSTGIYVVLIFELELSNSFYRFPNQVYDMMNQYSQTQQISSVPGNLYTKRKNHAWTILTMLVQVVLCLRADKLRFTSSITFNTSIRLRREGESWQPLIFVRESKLFWISNLKQAYTERNRNCSRGCWRKCGSCVPCVRALALAKI